MKYKLSVVGALSIVLLSACDGGSSGVPRSAVKASDAGSPSAPNSPFDPVPSDSTDTSRVGTSCANDAGKSCLAIKWVSYKDSAGNPTADKGDAARILNTMNRLFGTCGVAFQIDTYEEVDPRDYGLSYGSASQSQTSSIRRAFSNTHELLSVTTGPWGTSVNAWTAMPGSAPYGAIMEASIVNYGGGIIYAHEFGHYLGLGHVSSSSQLMSPTIYTSSTTLTASECQTVRNTAVGWWAKMLR